ncbi:MAG: hypothetical protein ACFFFK_06540, partial [Candidatus Thorarchaeota archaeon]
KFDHSSYPGFEAHLFTIADAAMWAPRLTSESEVVLTLVQTTKNSHESWFRLLAVAKELMESLNKYRQELKHGIVPSTHWASQETKWYRENWGNRPHELTRVKDFLYLVDESIRPHIKELNELGFSTTQSCSGLATDHLDREPYLPYVMFDERMFPKSSAHLFTLADVSGWIPSYGPHNFDVELRLNSPEGAEDLWNALVLSARRLAELLTEYRSQFE